MIDNRFSISEQIICLYNASYVSVNLSVGETVHSHRFELSEQVCKSLLPWRELDQL